jgi:TRAP-type mannitol/chloroaromatic compound transport system permease large subunit
VAEALPWLGLGLLPLAAGLMLCTGWPTYAVVLGVTSIGAAAGLGSGSLDLALLGSLGGRVVGLLEQDLLQALVLYALVGALLRHLGQVDLLAGGLARLFGRVAPRAAAPLAGLTLGALLAPLNGSVGASVLALAPTAATAWTAAGLPPARRAALLAAAGTLGVVVPPSLVLLLLGDAMMRAHTEGLNLARDLALPLAQAGLRVVNTQDLLQAVLLPGALLWLGWLALALWTSRTSPCQRTAPRPWPRAQVWALLVVPACIVGLLVLVSRGEVRAVEAAASAAVALLAWGAMSGRLGRRLLGRVLDDAMALSGALFALLVAATSLSFVLRALGTDRLVAGVMLRLQGQPLAATLAVLGVLLAASFVLDAFELVFLVVPIVMPPLLAQVGDAAWVAVLALLVLQAGFLMPPFGYAVTLARSLCTPRPALGALARAMAPYLAWTAAVAALVLAWPQTTRWLRSEPAVTAPGPQLSPEAVERALREMSAPRR